MVVGAPAASDSSYCSGKLICFCIFLEIRKTDNVVESVISAFMELNLSFFKFE